MTTIGNAAQKVMRILSWLTFLNEIMIADEIMFHKNTP